MYPSSEFEFGSDVVFALASGSVERPAFFRSGCMIINTTLGAVSFFYFSVETEPFAACSMREATARGCET
jgi:hypothetical protein